jgi:hypothetical protein
MRVGGGQAKRGMNHRSDAALFDQRGWSAQRGASPLSATERSRSVDPVVSRRCMTRQRLISFAPPSGDLDQPAVNRENQVSGT